MKTKKPIKIRYTLFMLTLFPALLLGTLFTIFAIKVIRSASEDSIENNLRSITKQLNYEFTAKYPGPYEIRDGQYYSSDMDVSPGQQILNRYKENFDCEVSIFFGDTRALTTIADSSGKLIIGTTQDNEKVLNTVLDGENYVSCDTEIKGNPYVVVYSPLYFNGEIQGMVFAGIRNEDFVSTINVFYRFILGSTFIMVALTGVVVSFYSSHMARAIEEIKDYLGNLVTSKSLETEMSPEALSRRDEIGTLASYSVSIGTQLNNIIGTDPLTGLYNRRSGRALLDSLKEQCFRQRSTFTIVMCDIDFFKKVNDTYGHDVGDMVLKRVSDIMINVCSSVPNSFAIRWGGEEILLGFMLSKKKTLELIETIRESIKSVSFKIDEDTSFSITATFGISSSEDCDDIHTAIIEADDKLYEGKKSGRDTVIS